MDDDFKCAHCGEPVGVYEPLVVVAGDAARETSRASEPQLASGSGSYYHRGCYDALKVNERPNGQQA